MSAIRGNRFWNYSRALRSGRASVLVLSALVFLGSVSFAQVPPSPQADPLSFLSEMKKGFDTADRTVYLQSFSSELRDQEGLIFDSLRQSFLMTSVLFKAVGGLTPDKDGETLFVNAVFRNDQESMLETWKLGLARDGERRVIRTKTISGNPAIFYDLAFPADRAVRAARIEIRHQDMEAVFEDAWIFFDNITHLETGLIIIGPGRLRFNPSSETERHQLALRYKSGGIDAGVQSAFLRFSPQFFKSNVKIAPASGPGSSGGPSPAETAAARNLFNRFYADSFSIFDPVDGRLLATLPQSDQAAFEFQTDARAGFGYSFNPFSLEEVRFWSRLPDHLLCLYSPDRAESEGKRMIISFGERYDLLRCDVDVDIQPDRFFLSAKARLEAQARLPGVENMRFDLNAALEVLRVADGEGRPMSFSQDKDRHTLTVSLLQPLDKGQVAIFDVFYRGVLQPPVQTSDIVQVLPYMGMSPDARPEFDSYLYSQSASWYPSSGETDFFLSRLRISVPPLYSCVAVGDFVKEEAIDEVNRVLTLEKIGNRLSTYETKTPIKYLAFIVGAFKRAVGDDEPGETVPIRLFVSEDIRIVRRSVIEEARSILKTYETIFGPFPFEKLTIVQRVWGTAGGHSPASFIVLNELARNLNTSAIPDPRSPVDLPQFKEFFMAHEIAHQWWGQSVAGATYHDLWLSEGLAQYSAVRYLKTKYGAKAFAAGMKKFVEWTEKATDFGPITLGARLSVHDFRSFQAILYGKSCVALFLLSDLIGEDVFDRGLRMFAERHAFGLARTSQFIEAMEEASGRPLREFFRGWFDSHLLPRVETEIQTVRRGEGYEVKITVKQTGRPMVFPLAVIWEEARRPVRHLLEVDGPVKTFTFPAAGKPAKIQINPEAFVPGSIR